eukprot:1021058-Pelagomonas_calceolata.AAC.2
MRGWGSKECMKRRCRVHRNGKSGKGRDQGVDRVWEARSRAGRGVGKCIPMFLRGKYSVDALLPLGRNAVMLLCI